MAPINSIRVLFLHKMWSTPPLFLFKDSITLQRISVGLCMTKDTACCDFCSVFLFQVPDLTPFRSNMTYLSLSHNRLKAVNLDYFADFPLMRTLIFSSNQITTINLTKPLTTLYLYFDSNRLTSINMDTFSVINEITYLTFRSNPLTEFIYPSSNGTVKLNQLSLSYTQVINEHVKVQNLSSLTYLELEHVGISTFNLSMFVELKNLVDINLNRNYNIEMAPAKNGTSLDKLKKVRLNICNLLGTFNLTQLSTPILPALTNLELYHNHLESLFIEDGYNLSSLVNLHLERNRITEFDLEFYIAVFPQLVTVNLRHNDITQVIFFISFVHYIRFSFLVIIQIEFFIWSTLQIKIILHDRQK